jgi:hypothetical protein
MNNVNWWLIKGIELCYPSHTIIFDNRENTYDQVFKTIESRSGQIKSLENVESYLPNYYQCIISKRMHLKVYKISLAEYLYKNNSQSQHIHVSTKVAHCDMVWVNARKKNQKDNSPYLMLPTY